MSRMRLLPDDRSGPALRSSIVHVVATRPDAVALAPVHSALQEAGAFHQLVLHTGQHADPVMAREILEDVGLPSPDHVLDAAGDHADQTAAALVCASRVLSPRRPAVMLVAGAANSTLGCALAAVKLGIPLARVDAGLREHDWSVPEEVNRVLLDRMADTLFAPSTAALANLRAEGIDGGRVYLAGSPALDTLRQARPEAEQRSVWRRYGVARGEYVVVTLHRPSNVDDDERLARIVEVLAAIAKDVPIVFPTHPRTRERLSRMGDTHRLLAAGVLCGPPLRYLDFLSLLCGAASVVTDSGTVQEEAAALDLPCFTLRRSTERTTTLTHGTNVLVHGDPRDLLDVNLLRASPHSPPVALQERRTSRQIAAALAAAYAVVPATAS